MARTQRRLGFGLFIGPFGLFAGYGLARLLAQQVCSEDCRYPWPGLVLRTIRRASRIGAAVFARATPVARPPPAVLVA